MKKIIFAIFIMLLTLPACAIENKIKFDNNTYNLSNKTSNEYNYYLKGETENKWSSRISIENFSNQTNKTEAAGDFAYKIQSENPGASVLLYPDAATLGYLTSTKEFYEYSTAVYQPSNNKGLNRLMYSKRFYSVDEGGLEKARESAIKFAQENNKKYMEMINQEAPKYKI